MSETEPIVYLNGDFIPRSQARLDIEDRGALFADGVYEVVRYFWGRPLGMDDHLTRLQHSLAAIRLAPPPDAGRLDEISDELIRRNGTAEATVYWQITRGSAPRDAGFPKDTPPTVLAITHSAPPLEPDAQPASLKAVLAPDHRWHRCDIKSLMLLYNVLAKNRALDQGAHEAILHRDDVVTEGTATSVFIVHRGELWTHPADQWILDGITRQIVIKLATEVGITIHQRPFTTDQLIAADEVMLCGTTKLIAGVCEIDGKTIGNNHPGPVTSRLYQSLINHIQRTCSG